jgi:hypothetical protein
MEGSIGRTARAARAIWGAAAAAALTLLGGCATAYQPNGLTGGFSETEVKQGLWNVTFSGNGYTSRETAQTYWLYRCADLTLKAGYGGFTIMSPMDLVQAPSRPGEGRIIRVSHGGGHVVVMGGYYGYGYSPGAFPSFSGIIQMIRGPVTSRPPRTFDAAALKATLAPYVDGPKCDGNVCPHVHGYIYPDQNKPET